MLTDAPALSRFYKSNLLGISFDFAFEPLKYWCEPLESNLVKIHSPSLADLGFSPVHFFMSFKVILIHKLVSAFTALKDHGTTVPLLLQKSLSLQTQPVSLPAPKEHWFWNNSRMCSRWQIQRITIVFGSCRNFGYCRFSFSISLMIICETARSRNQLWLDGITYQGAKEVLVISIASS